LKTRALGAAARTSSDLPARSGRHAQQQERAGIVDDVFGQRRVGADRLPAGALNDGDEAPVPSPDYPLGTAATLPNRGRAVHYPYADLPDAGSGADREADHAAHARDHHQPEQPDRRGHRARY
jgi:hypothetical protein